jgi:hypothetical protein
VDFRFVLWSYGITSAIKGETKPVPYWAPTTKNGLYLIDRRLRNDFELQMKPKLRLFF